MSQYLRRVPFHIRKKIESKIDELLKLDIIEPVSEATPWVSLLVAVPKDPKHRKNDDVRIVVDMRKPNTAIKRTHHPIPTIDETFEKFNQCTVFSKIDLLHGYHQIELHPESRPITTFSSHKGLFRYKRLVQGANAAFEEYQHEIGQLFVNEKHIENMISDDILIGGVDTKHHDENLRRCFQILKENGLTIKLEKCLFRKTEISFFGFKISSDGIKPMDDKIDAIMNFKEPTNVKEVKSFLGIMNFLSRFKHNLSSKTGILRKLTQKNVRWEWGSAERNAFNYLKNIAMMNSTLAHFNQRYETFLIVDAGPEGLGAILAQEQPDQSLRPVHFASKTLTKTEQSYSQIEKEAHAVLWGCKRFHLYLYGTSFTVLTDHKPLEILYTHKGKPSARILKWAIELQSYDFTIKHIKGLDNPADILSRQPLPLKQ